MTFGRFVTLPVLLHWTDESIRVVDGVDQLGHQLMRTSFLVVFAMLVTQTVWGEVPNSLAPEEQKAGFQTLFNGKDLDGWSHAGNWSVEDHAISWAGRGGALVYSRSSVPDDFELRFEWKVASGSNSGVYYRPTQYEYQVLDNALHADGKNPRTSAASLYFCMQPSEDNTRPVGEWNHARIVCRGTIIQHWLNGKKVIHFDYADPRWAFHVALLKNRGGNLEARGAKLSLQDHGDPVWYRNLRIRTLQSDDSIDMAPVTPAAISEAVLAAETAKLNGIIKRREATKAKSGRK